eukprot:1647490-Pleurochrysis_carterae.AAC.1
MNARTAVSVTYARWNCHLMETGTAHLYPSSAAAASSNGTSFGAITWKLPDAHWLSTPLALPHTY